MPSSMIPSVGELVDVVGLRDAAAHVDLLVEDAQRRSRGGSTRLRPSCRSPPSPLAASSSGVWIAPAATTTGSARTVEPAVARWSASTPRARPSRRSIRVARAPVKRLRPGLAAPAAGRSARRAAWRPSGSRRRRRRSPGSRGRCGAGSRRTSRARRRRGGSIARCGRRAPAVTRRRGARPRRARRRQRVGPSGSRPSSARQRSSTVGGVRKQVPEFTNVVPPVPRPSGSISGGRPSVAVCPPSR